MLRDGCYGGRKERRVVALRKRLMRYAEPAAILGGVLYFVMFLATVLIYDVYAEEAKGNTFGVHPTIHVLDSSMFALLLVGAIGVYLRQAGRLGKVGKAGFYLTAAGFGLGVVGGVAIIVVGIAVSDEATLGILDVVAHPLSMLLYSLGSLIFGTATWASSPPRGRRRRRLSPSLPTASTRYSGSSPKGGATRRSPPNSSSA
jgi:hypothetical protein